MPIKTILILLLVLMLPAQAMALGLGKLQTASSLNQPFEGEIPLLSLDVAELDTVRVKLASKEAFSRVNVDFPYWLNSLKFTPKLNASGKPVIRVYSSRSITEPYLNFLVEVNWPKGQIVREFAVLLDVR